MQINYFSTENNGKPKLVGVTTIKMLLAGKNQLYGHIVWMQQHELNNIHTALQHNLQHRTLHSYQQLSFKTKTKMC